MILPQLDYARLSLLPMEELTLSEEGLGREKLGGGKGEWEEIGM